MLFVYVPPPQRGVGGWNFSGGAPGIEESPLKYSAVAPLPASVCSLLWITRRTHSHRSFTGTISSLESSPSKSRHVFVNGATYYGDMMKYIGGYYRFIFQTI